MGEPFSFTNSILNKAITQRLERLEARHIPQGEAVVVRVLLDDKEPLFTHLFRWYKGRAVGGVEITSGETGA